MMHPEESEDIDEGFAASSKAVFIAINTFQFASKTLREKLDNKYGPYEEVFALLASAVDTAVEQKIPLELLANHLVSLYQAKCKHGAANDTAH
jgi:hypothetical protein